MYNEAFILGTTQSMYMKKESQFGVYLSSREFTTLEVLLPNNQVPNGIKKGDKIDVFLYKDSEDRLIATTTTPYVEKGQIASLRVKDVTNIGAFLDWGLAKDLFLPFKEQTKRVKVGDCIPVTLYVDKSNRLCATMHLYSHLDSKSPYKKGDKINGTIYEILDSYGAFVVIDNKYSALIPHNEMTRQLRIGEVIEGRIKEVKEDGKLTLSLQEKVKIQMGKDAAIIYEKLVSSSGFLPFHDKTSPEIIMREFKISKAAFKRALGRLKKEKKIDILDNGIKLIE